jgi:IclR family acetate operon transcriptional repressor
MAVGSSQTGARILRVLEAIAIHQPIGVRALARLLDDDKSAIHRAITTLSNEGWIHANDQSPPRWVVSPRILAVADRAFSGYDLTRRAKPVLQRLRDACGETVVLIVLEGSHLVVADVVESKRMLRWVPPIGSLAPPDATAAGRAILPYLAAERQTEILGREPDERLQAIYAATRARGYSVSDRETSPISASIGAPIFEADGLPVAVITIVGPSDRIAETGHEKLGGLVVEAAASLSQRASQE